MHSQKTMEDDSCTEALKVSALKWLADTGRLEQLQQQCSAYTSEVGTTRVVFKFVFRLDPSELLEHNAELGDLILHCPREAWRLFQQICFSTISSMGWLPPFFSPSQLLLILRLTALPDLPGYTIEHVSELPVLTTEPRFYTFHGVVCGISKMEKYTQHACFSCTNERCSGGSGEENKYIRLHVAGASEATTISNGDFTCYHCESQLVEDVSLRTLANKLKFHLVHPNALRMSASTLSPKLSQRYQAFNMVVRDELCEGVRMGGCYTVIGVPMYNLAEGTQQSFISTIVEVNNIVAPSPSLHTLKFSGNLPPSLMEMYQACQYSPWVFAATLAYSFAAEVCPPGSYHKLKLALLLSLVNASDSTGDRQKPKMSNQTFSNVSHSRFPVLDMLAIGSDTALLLQLMLYSSSLAPRSILHSSNNSLLGTVRKDASGSIFIDGGSLVLAEGGICVVGNLSSQKKDVRDNLQKTLETEKVTVTIPKRLGADDTQQVSWPLKGTVWACADQQHRNKTFGRADSEIIKTHSMQETSSLSKAFTDRLSIVMVTDPPSADSADYLSDMLTQHLLQAACGQTHTPLLPHDHFKQFLSVASSLRVELCPEARQLLQSFYMASRRVRMSSVHSTDMPNSALESMCAIALAHARLSLRTEANEADAVLAISLYEESLASRLGYSVLDIAPVPHFKDDDISQHIGKKYDSSMRFLHKRITQFCKCHVFTSSLDMPEE